MFLEKDGTFSWRKGLTAIVSFIFAFACIAFLFGCPELPQSYQIIIGGVFTFYFAKNVIRKEKEH